jgi:hypothetical protein
VPSLVLELKQPALGRRGAGFEAMTAGALTFSQPSFIQGYSLTYMLVLGQFDLEPLDM